MSLSRLGRCAISLSTAAMIAGCAQSSALGPSRGVPTAFGVMPVFGPGGLMSHFTQPRDYRKSWMSRDAKRIKELLYISDSSGTGDVYVYNYETGRRVGTLTGFEFPFQQCVDKRGDVWIIDGRASTANEYVHGGTSPIKVLSTNGFSEACSIDPTTGNLAVSNFKTPSSGPGDVEVWQDASGSPTIYYSQSCTTIWGAGYDNKGNLYVEAFGSSSPDVCELPAGGASLNPVSFNASLYDCEGGVMWDGKHLTLATCQSSPSGSSEIYRVRETASGGLTVKSMTILTDTCHTDQDATEFPFVVGTKNTPANTTEGKIVVGANSDCKRRFNYWAFSAGGNPTSSLADAPRKPIAESISIATK
jgi:hypothetical protein